MRSALPVLFVCVFWTFLPLNALPDSLPDNETLSRSYLQAKESISEMTAMINSLDSTNAAEKSARPAVKTRHSLTRVLSVNETLELARIAEQCEQRKIYRNAEDNAWIMNNAIRVLLMQAGFSLVEAGSVSAKHAGNVMMKNLLDMCIGGIVFWATGWGISHGTSAGGIIGTNQFFLIGFDDYPSWLFAYSFAQTAATIDSGAVAGRIKFYVYCIYSGIMTGFLYPVVAHWVWHADGFLNKFGFVDFAGSGAVHLVGGVSAFVLAWYTGPRQNRYPLSGGHEGLIRVRIGNFLGVGVDQPKSIDMSAKVTCGSFTQLCRVKRDDREHIVDSKKSEKLESKCTKLERTQSMYDSHLPDVTEVLKQEPCWFNIKYSKTPKKTQVVINMFEGLLAKGTPVGRTCFELGSDLKSGYSEEFDLKVVHTSLGVPVNAPPSRRFKTSTIGNLQVHTSHILLTAEVVLGGDAVNTIFGTLLLWVYWYSFNLGSTLTVEGDADLLAGFIGIITTLGGAFGGLSAAALSFWKTGAVEVSPVCNGVLGGLVGITGNCDRINGYSGIIIGITCGLLSGVAHKFITDVLKVDDPPAAISVHGVCGAVSLFATGLFACPNPCLGQHGEYGIFFGGNASLLGRQLLGAAVIVMWSGSTAYGLMCLFEFFGGVRLEPFKEEVGTSLSEHNCSQLLSTMEGYACANMYFGHEFEPEVVATSGQVVAISGPKVARSISGQVGAT